MKLYKVTYTVKNRKCMLPIISYYVITDNKELATKKGNELLAQEKHADRYKLSLVKLIEAHEVI